MRPIAFIAMACAAASGASAENADHYRGGWRTDAGPRQIYELVIDGAHVSGIACTQCADGTTMARITGSFDEKTGLSFTIRHLKPDGTLAYEDHGRGKLAEGKLVISGTHGGHGGGAFSQVAVKDKRGPTPSAFPVAILPPGAPPVAILQPAGGGGGGGRPPAYEPPAPWRKLSSADVVGVWLGFGVGMDKQYFVIRNDGERLFGLACGRCDNPYTFGALEIVIEGDTLKFDIVHQDWGDGNILPFSRHVTAHIAMNEMRIDARRPDQPNGPGIVSSLLGPIAIEATAGNVVPE